MFIRYLPHLFCKGSICLYSSKKIIRKSITIINLTNENFAINQSKITLLSLIYQNLPLVLSGFLSANWETAECRTSYLPGSDLIIKLMLYTLWLPVLSGVIKRWLAALYHSFNLVRHTYILQLTTNRSFVLFTISITIDKLLRNTEL